MPKDTMHWPAAFALALALANTSGSAGAVAESDDFFQPRALARHLDASLDLSAAADTVAAPAAAGPTRLAQWFNWFNCVSGTWRRC